MRTLILFATALAAAAQGPRLSEPVLGYIYDAGSQAIRKVSGVPGAASADPGLALKDSFAAACVNHALQLAVGIGKSGEVEVVNWRDGAVTGKAVLTPAFGTPGQVALARAADRALLVSPGGVELIAGLASSPASVWSWPASELGGVPRQASLSSGGTSGAVVLDSGRVMEVSGTGVRAVAAGRSAAYLPDCLDLLVVTDGGLARVSAAGSTVVASAAAEDELVGIAGNRAVLSNSKRGLISIVDLDSGVRTELNYQTNARSSQMLQMDGLFYIESPQSGGLLLDAGGPVPRVYPVPGIAARRSQ